MKQENFNINVGDSIKLKVPDGKGKKASKKINGKVISKNNLFFILQLKHYKESFRFIDITTKDIILI